MRLPSHGSQSNPPSEDGQARLPPATRPDGLPPGGSPRFPVSRPEAVSLLIVAAAIVVTICNPLVSNWRAWSANQSALATLRSAVVDLQVVYREDRGFTPPGGRGRLWPYLLERFPTTQWSKVSHDVREVAIARQRMGFRQSVEIGVYSPAGVCWTALLVNSPSSVAISSDSGIRRPGIYFGGTLSPGCGPSYLTPPGSGWQSSLAKVRL